MSTVRIEYSDIVPASPDVVYGVLSDYEVGHPAILPKAFKELRVTKGGQGAGTEFYTKMMVFGVTQEYNMVVTEPEPGHILTEEDPTLGTKTNFIFEAVENGQACRLTFQTDMPLSNGLAGWFEKKMNPPITKRVYKEEMENIKAYVQELHPVA